MAWTSPITWVANAVLTAAQLNQQIRDNMLAIWQGTSAGDIDYYTSATTKARLGIPSPGYALVLESNHAGTAPNWSWMGGYTAQAYRSTALSISSGGGGTALGSIDVTYWESDPIHPYHSGTADYFLIPRNGFYIFGFSGYFDSHVTGGTLRQAGWYSGGAPLIWTSYTNVASEATWVSCTWARAFSTGDTVQPRVLNGAAGALNFNSANMWIAMIR